MKKSSTSIYIIKLADNVFPNMNIFENIFFIKRKHRYTENIVIIIFNDPYLQNYHLLQTGDFNKSFFQQ